MNHRLDAIPTGNQQSLQWIKLEQVSRVIRQEAASQCGECIRPARAAAGEQCTVHSCIGSLQLASTCPTPPQRCSFSWWDLYPHL